MNGLRPGDPESGPGLAAEVPELDSKRFLLLPLALAAILLVPFRSYLTDDTFIYFQFARNLAHGKGFSFNAGSPVYAFTSPLWLLLLVLAERLGAAAVLASKILGAAFAGLSLVAFRRLAKQIIPSAGGRAAALLTFALNVWFLRWALSGLETPLAVFLVLAGMAAWMEEKERDASPGWSALAFGLAGLSRPECLGILPLAAADLMLSGAPRRGRKLLRLAGGAAISLLPWMLYAQHAFGQMLPVTVFAKGGSLKPSLAAQARTFRKIAMVLTASTAFEIPIMAAAILVPAGSHLRPPLRRCFLPLAWMLALPALYMARGATLVSRYLLPAIGLIVLFGFAALDHLRARLAPGDKLRARAPAFLLLGAGALNLAVLGAAAIPSARSFTRGLHESLIPIGIWLNRNTAQGATVAVADIGAIGYFSEREVLDLYGLVSPAIVPIFRTRSLDEEVESLAFAAAGRPDYLVDRYPAPDRFGTLGLEPGVLEPVLTRRLGGLGIGQRTDQFYTLYRIHWDRYRPGPMAADPRSGALNPAWAGFPRSVPDPAFERAQAVRNAAGSSPARRLPPKRSS